MKKNYNMKKIDKGFEPVYWNLSYRRKFIRTLWMIPIIILAILIVWVTYKSVLIKWIFTIVMISVEVLQAVYTYKKWKNTDEKGAVSV